MGFMAVLVIVLTIFLVGYLRKDRLTQCVIVFPDSLECISGNKAEFRHLEDSAQPDYKLVMLIDSLQCSFCKVQKLQRYRALYEESIEEKRFDLIIILSPKKDDIDTLRDYLFAHDLYLPVYLDPSNAFLSMNPCIPSDVDAHTFLLDASGHPVFVGDPLKGNRAYERFERLIGGSETTIN